MNNFLLLAVIILVVTIITFLSLTYAKYLFNRLSAYITIDDDDDDDDEEWEDDDEEWEDDDESVLDFVDEDGFWMEDCGVKGVPVGEMGFPEESVCKDSRLSGCLLKSMEALDGSGQLLHEALDEGDYEKALALVHGISHLSINIIMVSESTVYPLKEGD